VRICLDLREKGESQREIVDRQYVQNELTSIDLIEHRSQVPGQGAAERQT
jgi:hypothetical protein